VVSTSVESENIIMAVSSAPVALTAESSASVSTGASAGCSAGCSEGCSEGATVSTVVVSCGSEVLRPDIEALANTLLTDTITIAAIAAKNNFFICVNF